MAASLGDLLQRDHDEIARLLDTIVMPGAPISLVIDALDRLRLAVLAHTTAEAHTMRRLSQLEPMPRVRDLERETRREHLAHQRSVAALVKDNLFGQAWCELAVELRRQMVDHAFSTDRTEALLSDCVPPHLRTQLARTYASKRMRVLQMAPVRLVVEIQATG